MWFRSCNWYITLYLKAKMRSSTWWIRFFVQTSLEENEAAAKKFEQAASKQSYKPGCQVFHLNSYHWYQKHKIWNYFLTSFLVSSSCHSYVVNKHKRSWEGGESAIGVRFFFWVVRLGALGKCYWDKIVNHRRF